MSIPVASWLSLSSALAALGIAVALGGDLERFDRPRRKKTEHAKARTAAPERRPATRPSSSPPAMSPARGGRKETAVMARGNSATNGTRPVPTAPPMPGSPKGGLTAGERALVNALPSVGRRDFANKRSSR